MHRGKTSRPRYLAGSPTSRRVGFGGVACLGALSTLFVQDRYHASNVNKATPTTLTTICIQIASDTSTSTKCPAKDRKFRRRTLQSTAVRKEWRA